MKKEVFTNLVTWLGIIIILIIFFSLKSGSIGSKACPESIEGNSEASLTIRYFKSPFCIYCWFESPLIKEVMEEKGDLFKLETYDTRYCKEEIYQYKVAAVPTHVFSIEGKKDVIWYGYMNKEQWTEHICTLTGEC